MNEDTPGVVWWLLLSLVYVAVWVGHCSFSLMDSAIILRPLSLCLGSTESAAVLTIHYPTNPAPHAKPSDVKDAFSALATIVSVYNSLVCSSGRSKVKTLQQC